MKRDFDLIRKLLIFFEEKEGPESVILPRIEGYSDIQIKYHCILLYDAGLLMCEPVISSTSDRVISVIPFDLTWNGHEFLTKIKNENIWKKVKEQIKEKGINLSFNLVNEIAKKLLSESLIGS